MDLPGLDPGGADQLVDIDRARPKGRHDQFAFGLADVGQRLGRPVLIGGGKLGRRRKRRTSQDRRERLQDVVDASDQGRALLQQIIGAGGSWIEPEARGMASGDSLADNLSATLSPESLTC